MECCYGVKMAFIGTINGKHQIYRCPYCERTGQPGPCFPGRAGPGASGRFLTSASDVREFPGNFSLFIHSVLRCYHEQRCYLFR
jgi:hypothetical protein